MSSQLDYMKYIVKELKKENSVLLKVKEKFTDEAQKELESILSFNEIVIDKINKDIEKNYKI